MNITIVLGAFFPVPTVMGGAVEKVWLALGEEFARRGHTVTMISRAMPDFPRNETRSGVRHIRVQGFDSPRSLVWLKVLDFLYSRRARAVLPPADILVTNTFWLPLLALPRSTGILYVHAARFPKGQMRLYRRAARIQTPSQDVARAIAAELPSRANDVRVIPNPLPETLANSEPPPPVHARERIILYVGRVHPEKGIAALVRAFADMQPGGWRLRVVGPAEEKHGGGGTSFLRELQRLAGEADVEFTGPIFVPGQLVEEYRAARVFAYPSVAEKGESFGLAPLEAMANGCAVLVSGLPCFQDFIRDGETGFVFDHRQPDPAAALRARLGTLLADESLLERVAAAGYRTAADYSVERVAGQFLDDFESLVNAHGETGTR